MPNDIDEDLIEATIRRVAESKAARATGQPIEMPVSEAVAPVYLKPQESTDEPADATNLEPAQDLAVDVLDDDDDIEVTLPSVTPMPRLQPRPMPMSAPSVGSVAPQHAQDVGIQLQRIADRLDAVVPLLERIASGAGAGGGEWDRDTPRSPIMMAPRSATAREGAAGVERSAPDVIDSRPLPKPLPPFVEPKRGFDLLPRNYRITVEDRRGGVDLVPLHRAMLGLEGVRDMSLLSYNNGVAIVALETADELDPEAMRLSVGRAMQCDARVEVHNESTMVVKLNEE
jgi:hypothetical protein